MAPTATARSLGDYDAARADAPASPKEDISFVLCGRTWHLKPVDEQAGILMLDFLTSETVTRSLASGKELLLEAIVEDEQDDFRTVLVKGQPGRKAIRASKANGIKAEPAVKRIPPPDMPLLDTIIADLAKEVLGRPTEPQ